MELKEIKKRSWTGQLNKFLREIKIYEQKISDELERNTIEFWIEEIKAANPKLSDEKINEYAISNRDKYVQLNESNVNSHNQVLSDLKKCYKKKSRKLQILLYFDKSQKIGV